MTMKNGRPPTRPATSCPLHLLLHRHLSPRLHPPAIRALLLFSPDSPAPLLTNAQAPNAPLPPSMQSPKGLRVWPPGCVFNLPSSYPRKATTWDGKFIPGGTKHRVFGLGLASQPARCTARMRNVFRPERWLEVEAGSEIWKEMQRSVELVFGYGK